MLANADANFGRLESFLKDTGMRDNTVVIFLTDNGGYPMLAQAPVDAETLLQVRRPEDAGAVLWNSTNRVQETLIRGGVSDHHRDQRGKVRSVRALRGIDSKVDLNKGLWRLAEQILEPAARQPAGAMALPA